MCGLLEVLRKFRIGIGPNSLMMVSGMFNREPFRSMEYGANALRFMWF